MKTLYLHLPKATILRSTAIRWLAAVTLFGLIGLPGTSSAQTWNQLGIDIDGETADDLSGHSVSLSADGLTMAIGAIFNDGNGTDAGHVRVYQLIAGVWTQQGADIDGEAGNDLSGQSVSLSADGSILAIGAWGNNGNGFQAGHVRVYQLIAGVWTQQGADIDGEAAGDRSGGSVCLSSDGLTLAIGAPFNGNDAGHVRVYQFTAGAWTQQGADIDGEGSGDRSGWSVSLSADGLTVAIGAPLNNGGGFKDGHVRAYQLIAGVWTQLGTDLDGEAAEDQSGYSVSLSADGLIIAVGAPYNDGNGFGAGHVRVYQLIAGVWTQLGVDIGGEAIGDHSGWSVSLSADGLTVAIGAPLNNGGGFKDGHVRVYQLIAGVWTQQGPDIDGEAANDQSGWSASLSADGLALAIGAPFNDGNGLDAGHVRVYKVTTVGIVKNDFGAALTFYPNPSNGQVSIDFGQHYTLLNVAVTDISGKQVATYSFRSTDRILFEIEGATGLYFIDISSAEGKTALLKVMKN